MLQIEHLSASVKQKLIDRKVLLAHTLINMVSISSIYLCDEVFLKPLLSCSLVNDDCVILQSAHSKEANKRDQCLLCALIIGTNNEMHTFHVRTALGRYT
jgi:hypothetical protein